MNKARSRITETLNEIGNISIDEGENTIMQNIFEDIAGGNYFKVVYFDVHVLERYFNNPKYYVFYSGYRGKISIKDEYYDENTESEYIKNFGLAYENKNPERRAIVAFASDLAKISKKAQGHWYSYLLENTEEYHPNNGFIKNLIHGEWVENISIFDALLMEIHVINKMCESIEIPKLYKEEFKYNTMNKEDRPINYHIVLLPTRDNYYNFINTLEKLVVNNLEPDTFTQDAHLIRGVERKSEEGFNKGTLVLMKDWFKQNVQADDIEENIIKPLKKLRKIRQKPAHQLYENVYDEQIWIDQKKLMHNVYTAVRNIRLLLANHPLSKDVKIPKILFEGKKIVQY